MLPGHHLFRSTIPGVLLAALLWPGGPAWALPAGLTFHVSFDKLSTDADFAAGDGHSTFNSSLELRSAEGIRGVGLLQQPGERCSYPVAGNLDTSQGTFSLWVKPLNWDGHSGKFRHFLVVTGPATYRMLFYLYPVGDEAILSYIQVNAGTPEEAIWRAGAPVDLLKHNEWTHLATTWDSTGLCVYANGRRVGEGLISSPLPKIEEGTFTVCPIEYWKHAKWSAPDEQTLCDEVRVFSRPLTDDEILDLCAEEVPGGLADLKPELRVSLQPDYFGNALAVMVRAAHLDEAWRKRLEAGGEAEITARDPGGKVLLSRRGPLPGDALRVPVEQWTDGDYLVEAALTAGGETLRARETITRPPTPWLPAEKDWRADRVLEPWTPLELRDGAVRYWNGEVSLAGGLPAQVTSAGEPLLAAPVRLVADGPAEGGASRVTEEKPFRITFAGTGRLGDFSASCETLMEFDGLIRVDLTLTPPDGGAELPSLTLEIPLRAEVAAFYRNPTCQEWDGQALDEERFLPYGWVGTEERGLSWFMESDANWRLSEGRPALTLRREGEAVIARLHLITEPTRVTGPLTYTIGFEATPVRPLDPGRYDLRFASGPQFRGSSLFVYGWGQQISALNGRLLAHDPEAQRALVEKWRAAGKHAISYSCTQCTANLSPEYRFFGEEWNLPYGGSFSGYKRVGDDAPYSMVPVCTRSTFADFLVWCAKEHLRQGWGDGIYTDIDGATACDNALHGCGFTDAFGRSGRTWPLYAHRGVSRRLYAACRDAGKVYFAHAHSHWYSLFNAFNDGWCPGEQYSHAAAESPTFYMDGIPDRVWRSEFYSPTTGVTTFLLPELGRLAGKDALKDPGPSESCITAAMAYGVPLWAGSIHQGVVEAVWAAQQDFGMADARFVPFWSQGELLCADSDLRVSLWRKPGKRLVVVANFTDEDRTAELRPAAPAVAARFTAAWKAEDLSVAGGVARFSVPAKRGALVVVEGLP